MSNDTLGNPQALAQQLMSAANSLSDEEATQRYRQILSQLPPDQAAELNELAMSQVATGERQSLAAQFRQAHNDPSTPFDGYSYNDDDEAADPRNLGQMSVRAQQQDPALLGSLFGNNSGLGGQIGKAALAALAALLIRRMMSGQSAASVGGNPAGGNAIGSILGGLLGGGGGYGGQPMQGGGLDSILGGLLGGGGFGGQPMPRRNQPMPGGDLGSILGGLLGGGAASQYTPRGGGDLGSILGSILGGGGASPAQPGAGSHRRKGVHLGDDQ